MIIEIVEEYVHFASRMGRDAVHEAEELDAAPVAIMAGRDLAIGHAEDGDQLTCALVD